MSVLFQKPLSFLKVAYYSVLATLVGFCLLNLVRSRPGGVLFNVNSEITRTFNIIGLLSFQVSSCAISIKKRFNMKSAYIVATANVTTV